ncbi:MAG: methyltransferase domain-containing protein [Candidatus Moraniibacteriota bacterium]|nr:MAG: methyltransferase domain-containing protein [Candidatus Moranbacteria bacterium]
MLFLKQFFYNFLLDPSVGRCLICFSTSPTKEVSLQNDAEPISPIKHRVIPFSICDNCGYCSAPVNKSTIKYNPKKPPKTTRIGDGMTPGREYFMTIEALRILNRSRVSIGIFGAGKSRDHELIRALPGVTRCSVMDLRNHQNSPHYLPINTKGAFDIVIACEVVEHFMNPRREFSNLFKKVQKNGLLIVSTSLRIEDNFEKYIYPFLYGHTSYYTGRSLMFLAAMNRMFIDFRTPSIGIRQRSAKRYIYLTPSRLIRDRVVASFSRYRFAASEPATIANIDGTTSSHHSSPKEGMATDSQNNNHSPIPTQEVLTN